MSPYAKTITAVIGAAVTAALGTVPEDSTVFTTLTVIAAVLTALGVYTVPNTPATPHQRTTYTDNTHPPDMM